MIKTTALKTMTANPATSRHMTRGDASRLANGETIFDVTKADGNRVRVVVTTSREAGETSYCYAVFSNNKGVRFYAMQSPAMQYARFLMA